MFQPRDARRFIKISGGPAANCQLVCIENSDNKNNGTLSALPQTTKADKALHGFGLRSVNSVLKRYGGAMTITQENSSYTASLLIPVKA